MVVCKNFIVFVIPSFARNFLDSKMFDKLSFNRVILSGGQA